MSLNLHVKILILEVFLDIEETAQPMTPTDTFLSGSGE